MAATPSAGLDYPSQSNAAYCYTESPLPLSVLPNINLALCHVALWNYHSSLYFWNRNWFIHRGHINFNKLTSLQIQ